MLCACSLQISADVGSEAVCFPEGGFSILRELLLLLITLIVKAGVFLEKLG